MTMTTLIVAYFVVGAALGAQASLGHAAARRTRRQTVAAAVVMVLLWPLVAPFVFLDGPTEH